MLSNNSNFFPNYEDAHTAKSRKYKTYLWIYFGVIVLVEILKIALLNNWNGIFNVLVMGLILYCAISQLSYWMLTQFMLYLLFPMMENFFRFGQYLQDWDAYFGDQCAPNCSYYTKMFVFSVLIQVINSFGVYLIFLEYREFKAIQYEKAGVPVYGGNQSETVRNYGATDENDNQVGENSTNQRRNFNAFNGRGVVIGGE